MILFCSTFLFRSLVAYILLSFTFVLWNISLYNFSQRYVYRNRNVNPDVFNPDDVSNSEVSCKVPQLDPWDPSIVKFVKHPRQLICKQVQDNVTQIDMDGYLRLTPKAERILQSSRRKFICNYRTFDRSLGLNDNSISYYKENELVKPTKLSEDMVEIFCKVNDTGAEFYHNVHAHPAQRDDRVFGSPNENKLTVLMFYIDSVSYSALQRNLPATYSYTANVMKMIYFEGFNKIGDNSFPNLMAALIGKRVADEQAGMLREMPGDYSKIKFDSWPMIWKLFGAKGYATVFNEDKPLWGLFHYLAKGFAKKPVDFYYHTFWTILDWARNKNHSRYCYANEPRPRIQLDILRRHLVSMQDKLQFIYNFHTELSHDHLDEVERYDDDLSRFWNEMYQGGYLNKTVIIFNSDHGHRFSKIRSTLVGLLEERLPFFGIWFPEWFYQIHPKIKTNLLTNSKLLSSTFDIHETLLDILNENFEGSQRSLTSRGLSQLYPLPRNRTCSSAGIPDHYCTCANEIDLNNNTSMALTGANHLVSYLNNKLKDHVSLCHVINLNQILYVRKIDFNDEVKRGVHSFNGTSKEATKNEPKELESRLRFAIETEPFGAQFEALFKVKMKIHEAIDWQIIGNVARLNSYQGLAECIDDADLRKYCSCKNNTVLF